VNGGPDLEEILSRISGAGAGPHKLQVTKPGTNEPAVRNTLVGSVTSGIAALVAHVTFWLLLAYGWFWEDLGPVAVAVFLGLWTAGFFGLPYVGYGSALFPSYVAILDVVLVFLIFKGDVRLT